MPETKEREKQREEVVVRTFRMTRRRDIALNRYAVRYGIPKSAAIEEGLDLLFRTKKFNPDRVILQGY
jgi:hypothetical protein